RPTSRPPAGRSRRDRPRSADGTAGSPKRPPSGPSSRREPCEDASRRELDEDERSVDLAEIVERPEDAAPGPAVLPQAELAEGHGRERHRQRDEDTATARE